MEIKVGIDRISINTVKVGPPKARETKGFSFASDWFKI